MAFGYARWLIPLINLLGPLRNAIFSNTTHNIYNALRARRRDAHTEVALFD